MMRPRTEIEHDKNGCALDELPVLQLEVLLDIRDLLTTIKDHVEFTSTTVQYMQDPNGPLMATLNGIYTNTATRR